MSIRNVLNYLTDVVTGNGVMGERPEEFKIPVRDGVLFLRAERAEIETVPGTGHSISGSLVHGTGEVRFDVEFSPHANKWFVNGGEDDFTFEPYGKKIVRVLN